MSKLHVSLDDTKGIFKAIRDGEKKSIFETRTLSFLQELHLKYDTEFTLYCTYADADYQLEDVTEIYRDEFMKHSKWLHFGFHCFRESDEISKQDLDQFVSNFTKFEEQIRRVTGQEEIGSILRLHGFQGNKMICSFLKEIGVQILLASDDERRNYFLDERQNHLLQTQRRVYDESLNIEFVKSCIRLEDAEDIMQDLIFRKREEDAIIPVFTHEWQMDYSEIRDKLEACCKWGAENNV